jgi:hypothetical protein
VTPESTVPIAVALITTGPALVAVLVQNTRLGRRLRTVEGHTSTTAAELSPNHGSSAKDLLDRLEAGQKATSTALAQGQRATNDALADIRADIGGIRSEMRTERDERHEVAKRVTAMEARKPTT